MELRGVGQRRFRGYLPAITSARCGVSPDGRRILLCYADWFVEGEMHSDSQYTSFKSTFRSLACAVRKLIDGLRGMTKMLLRLLIQTW